MTQGILSYSTTIQGQPSYIVLDGGTASFAISESPVQVVFAHGDANYLISLDHSVVGAWTLLPQSSNHLFWEINRTTAEVGFIASKFAQYVSEVEPEAPANGQHWFDLHTKQMKVWDNSRWTVVIRVYAGKISGSTITYPAEGSQAGLTGDYAAGYILLDDDTQPLRNSKSQFLTTETAVRNKTTNGTAGFITRPVDTYQPSRATENIPKLSLVRITGENEIGLATSTQHPIGIVLDELYEDEQGYYVRSGEITSDTWNFSAELVGLPIWSNDQGQLSTIRPSQPQAMRVGTIKNHNTIFLSFSLETTPSSVTLDDAVSGMVFAELPLTSTITIEDGGVSTTLRLSPSSSLSAGYMSAQQAADLATLKAAAPQVTELIQDVTNIESTIVEQQADLQVLEGEIAGLKIGKANTVHTHVIGDVTALQSTLDGKVNKAGDTMLGYLMLSSDPSQPGHAATMRYVDSKLSSATGLIPGSGIVYDPVTKVISLPQEVGTSSAVVFGRLQTQGDVIVGGNLIVQGTTTSTNTETLEVGDQRIVLNSEWAGPPALDGFFEVNRGTSANAAIKWNEALDTWQFTNNGTDYFDFVTTSGGTSYTDQQVDARIALASINALADVNTDQGLITGHLLSWDGQTATWRPQLPQPAGIQFINGKTGTNVQLTTDDIPAGITNKYLTYPGFLTFFNSAISATSINALVDVQTERTIDGEVVFPSEGQVLTFNETLDQWIPATLSVNVTSVNGLIGDVVLTTNQVPEIEGQGTVVQNMYWTTQRGLDFLRTTASITDLSDVDRDMEPLPNDVLIWTGSRWTNTVIPAAPVQSVAGRLGDVVLTTSDVAEGSRLYWTTERWNDMFINARLNGLYDVSTSNAQNGQYLMYQGNPGDGQWVAAEPVGAPVTSVNTKTGAVVLTTDDIAQGSSNQYFTPAAFNDAFDEALGEALPTISINDLEDVSTGGVVDGQFLQFDNGAWRPALPPGAPVTTVNGENGDVVLLTTDIDEPPNPDPETFGRFWFSKARFDSHFDDKKLDDLSGVADFVNLQPFDVLLYDGTQWKNVPVPSAPVQSVAGRTGVITLQTSDVPEGGSGGQYWTTERFDLRFENKRLSGLFDVTGYSTADEGKYLKAVIGSNGIQWEPAAPPGAPVSSVAGRTGDIVLTTSDVAEGSRLYFTTARVQASLQQLSLNDFNDVTIVNPQEGQVVRWNGIQWVNDFAAVSSSSIIAGLGYTPANKAGDTFTGAITVSNSATATRFVSTVSTGTPPMTVASSTMVQNLNAERLNGQPASFYAESFMTIALSDETSNVVAGTNKITFRAPFSMTLSQIPRASLSTSGSTAVELDIKLAGVSVLGANKLSIDANEKTSTTAATPTTLAITAIPDDGEITVDVTANGTVARGLKLTLYYRKN